MLTVLQVLPALKSGGVESHVIELVKGLNPSFIKSIVCSNGGELVNTLTQRQVTHESLPIHSKNPIKVLINSYKLRKIIKNQSIDVIHVHSRVPACVVYLATLFLKTPWISTYHGAYKAKNIFKKFYNRIMTKGVATIAISHFMKDHIQKEHPRAKIILIPEAIDTTLFTPNASIRQEMRQKLGFKQDERVFLLAGRWTRLKGHLFFLKALKIAQKKNPSIKGVLVGEKDDKNPKTQELLTLCKDLNCLVLDATKDIHTVFQAVDCVVSCSLVPESFGRITAEALCMQLPYIGTNLGATVELCENVEGTVLLEPGRVDELANALLRAPLSSNGREKILSSHSLESMCLDHEKLYHSMVC